VLEDVKLLQIRLSWQVTFKCDKLPPKSAWLGSHEPFLKNVWIPVLFLEWVELDTSKYVCTLIVPSTSLCMMSNTQKDMFMVTVQIFVNM